MPLTVIIPVYNAFDVLGNCLDSVAATASDHSVLIVDDDSSDERVSGLLDCWVAENEERELLRLPENRGFVHAVNRGMMTVEGDVVLLNSDTVVAKGWIESLEHCLASDPRIATATPWTNNGEIVSFPEFCAASPLPADIDCIARAARSSKTTGYPDLPTAVGFCMAISRAAIDKLGYFDETSFGMGYGEENDFSMRAAGAGLRNVLCDDAYVGHVGGQSFGPLGLSPDQASMQRLLDKHPGYLTTVMSFIESDPLAGRRKALAHAIQGADA